MNRKDLLKTGQALAHTGSADGVMKKAVYRVTYSDKVVGVGLFCSDQEECKMAFVHVSSSQRSLLCELTDDFPIETDDVYHLKRCYHELFPNSKQSKKKRSRPHPVSM
ncbi:hypothetical protein [Sphingobacterium suaedae]|uniref:Uncharacterized protein n=1 Tax=Sphingobacterium suaedae TaxID=1686402 RepID=A0ABW5KG08_9SPHI